MIWARKQPSIQIGKKNWALLRLMINSYFIVITFYCFPILACMFMWQVTCIYHKYIKLSVCFNEIALLSSYDNPRKRKWVSLPQTATAATPAIISAIRHEITQVDPAFALTRYDIVYCYDTNIIINSKTFLSINHLRLHICKQYHAFFFHVPIIDLTISDVLTCYHLRPVFKANK